MCRSIKTLRPPYVEHTTDEEVRAAALQYVRKVSGFRAPSRANTEAFERAVDAVAAATADLLAALEGPRPAAGPGGARPVSAAGTRPPGSGATGRSAAP